MSEIVDVNGASGVDDDDGVARQVGQGALGQDATVLHDDDAVSQSFGFAKFVRRNEKGATQGALFLQQGANDLSPFGVDGRSGFVED